MGVGSLGFGTGKAALSLRPLERRPTRTSPEDDAIGSASDPVADAIPVEEPAF
jgi:hypothetical protein